MEDLNEGIVEQYAGHLLKRASSVVVSFTVVGVIGGAALGSAPGFLSHSLIPAGTKYFAVLLGAVAGGFLARSIGDRRALGLRLQAQMALRQLQLESRFVTAPTAPAARPVAPAPVSPAVTAPPAAPAPAAPVAAPVPPAVRARPLRASPAQPSAGTACTCRSGATRFASRCSVAVGGPHGGTRRRRPGRAAPGPAFGSGAAAALRPPTVLDGQRLECAAERRDVLTQSIRPFLGHLHRP